MVVVNEIQPWPFAVQYEHRLARCVLAMQSMLSLNKTKQGTR